MGVPWFGLLAILMYGCSQGGVGWQFWPIAQIFGGGVAAAAGGVSAELVRRWRSRRRGMRAGG
jgi:hypothetical protein